LNLIHVAAHLLFRGAKDTAIGQARNAEESAHGIG
jgi:hypothetical protein